MNKRKPPLWTLSLVDTSKNEPHGAHLNCTIHNNFVELLKPEQAFERLQHCPSRQVLSHSPPAK